MPLKSKPPENLGQAGRELWAWAEKTAEIAGTEPALRELCECADRLQLIRTELRKGLDPRLLSAECKFGAQFCKLWRLLGFADPPDSEKRPIGRPAGIPLARRG